jgi:hypothetical protein
MIDMAIATIAHRDLPNALSLIKIGKIWEDFCVGELSFIPTRSCLDLYRRLGGHSKMVLPHRQLESGLVTKI